MTTFSTGGSAVTFTTSGSAVSFAVTPASNAFTTSAVLTPGAHASTHGAGGADPITTLGAVAHSGQQTFAAGSAGGPSIAFTGDTNTGVFSPTADQIALATAGTARLSVDNVTNGYITLLTATTDIKSDSTTALFIRQASTDTDGADNNFDKYRGTLASPTVVASGDQLGTIWFRGYDGSALRNAAAIRASVDGSPGASDMPGRLEFYTTLDGSASLSERLRISNNGQLTTGLGSAGTPVLSFSGDTNTGIYSPGADQVGIATAGTARAIVDATGQLGLNVTPGATLHVAASSGQTSLNIDTAGNNSTLRQRRAATSLTSPTVVASGDRVAAYVGQGYDGSNYQSAGIIAIEVDGAPSAGDMPGRIMFLTTPDASNVPTERLRIDSAGQITTGLGSATAPVLSFTGDTNTGIYSPGADQVGIATAGTARVVVDGSGNVGVGMTAVNSIDTAGAIGWGNGVGRLTYSGSTAYIDGRTNNTSEISFRQNVSGSSTERMRIDNAGLITGTGTSLGAWTSYTPTLGGTGWAIGDGTVTGVYSQIGKWVAFSITVTFGSTSTFGAGSATLTVPVTMKSSDRITVNAWGVDTSLSQTYALMVTPSSTSAFFMGTIGTNGLRGGVISSNPFTWADTDVIRVTGFYEAA